MPIAALLCAATSLGAAADDGLSILELRRLEDGRLPDSGDRIPRDIVDVFVFEGEPVSVRVTRQHIAVSYGDHAYDGNSGALFDRETGKLARRFTVVDGWPGDRPDEFAAPRRRWERGGLVGPGVVDRLWDPDQRRGRDERQQTQAVATAVLQGTTYRAVQATLEGVLRSVEWRQRRERFANWSSVLSHVHAASYVEQISPTGKIVRFTTRHGLAGNIVSHLVVSQGTLWAACVDVYDPGAGEWTVGGLCRFDPERRRWTHVDRIDGRPVRWVTLLQSIGDELWVGFREGDGIAGDEIVYGMGLYPGVYRPHATSLVLGRFADGEWTTFSRAPFPDPVKTKVVRPGEVPPPYPSTERPHELARSGDNVILLSQMRGRRVSGNWHVELDGHVSMVDLREKRWRSFDVNDDLDADVVIDMFAENEEVVLTTNRGAHQWDALPESWRFLDTDCTLLNPSLSVAVPVGDELWVGYTNLSFGVWGQQGISRYDERTNSWAHISPAHIGTSCPVREIVPLHAGDVYVLFAPRPWHGAAHEFPYYARENWRAPAGMGRFVDGAWEFPARLDGVPTTEQREYQGKTYEVHLPPTHLVELGKRLFVANNVSVYVGPGEWERVATGSRIHRIWPSEDGKALVIWREQRDERRSTNQLGRYEPATGRIRYRNIKPGSDEWNSLSRRDYPLAYRADERWAQTWVRIPAGVRGDWVVGPLGTQYHRAIETSRAVWIASRGELLRLDRARLAAWASEKERQ